jgi:translation elongation factor EF-Tu-like GTPase
MRMETMIGKVTHFYPKVGVAAIVLEDHLERGDRIHIHGHSEDFYQTVTSMEMEHVPVTEADSGQDIGVRVEQRVHPGDVVYREL